MAKYQEDFEKAQAETLAHNEATKAKDERDKADAKAIREEAVAWWNGCLVAEVKEANTSLKPPYHLEAKLPDVGAGLSRIVTGVIQINGKMGQHLYQFTMGKRLDRIIQVTSKKPGVSMADVFVKIDGLTLPAPLELLTAEKVIRFIVGGCGRGYY